MFSLVFWGLCSSRNKRAFMAAHSPEQRHHSMCLVHPRRRCGERRWQKGEGASARQTSGRLELLFSAGLEQNTFSFCPRGHSSRPVTQTRFSLAEAVGSDPAEEQQLRDARRPRGPSPESKTSFFWFRFVSFHGSWLSSRSALAVPLASREP